MDFCFASLVLVAMIGVALLTAQMLTWRSTQGEIRATRAEVVALRNSVFGALRFTHGFLEAPEPMLERAPAERSLIERLPNPLFAPRQRQGAGRPQRLTRVTPLDRITPDMPEQLDALIQWAETIDLAEEDIPLWLRRSDHSIGLQKLAVFLQSPNVLRPDPDAPPEMFDPLWVQVLADLSRTRPDATFSDIVAEFHRRAALEESEAGPPSKQKKSK